jgi:hypothetical protein
LTIESPYNYFQKRIRSFQFYWGKAIILLSLFNLILINNQLYSQCGPFQVHESFGNTTIPTQGGTWSATSMYYGNQFSPRSGQYGLTFDATGDIIQTPLIVNPGVFSFWYKRSTNTTAWSCEIETSPDGLVWTSRGTIGSITGSFQQYSIDLGALGLTNIYVRVRDTRASGINERYIDDMSWTSTTPTDNTILIQGTSCSPSIICGVNYKVYDVGGVNDQYNNNMISAPMVITPSSAGGVVTASFSSLATESGYDGLLIYNGNSTGSTLISSGSTFGRATCPNGAWSGNTAPPVITSTAADGSLTFNFRSDGSEVGAGWAATISCILPCSGTPAGGTAAATVTLGCSGYNSTLSVTGSTSNVTGLTYQWESSTDGVTWINASGTSTNATYNATGVSGSIRYRRKITCGANSAYSSEILLQTTPCYLLTSSTTVNTCAGLFYDSGGSSGDYTSSQNRTITFTPSTAGAKIQVTFTSFNTESGYDGLLIYNGNSTGSPLISSGSTFGRATCPNGAWTGTTAPPVITSTAADGSLTFNFQSDGATVGAGWAATISCILPCSGTPTGGTAASSVSAGCSGFSSSLSVAGSNAGEIGTTFQWQRSTDNGVTWTNIAGATGATYLAIPTQNTQYRRQITCAGSGLSSFSGSTSLTVNDCTTSTTYTALNGNLKNCDAWNNSTSIPISVNGLPTSGLSTCGTVLREVRVKLGNPTCKKPLSTYRLELKNPQGIIIPLAGKSGGNGLTTISSSSIWADIKFRDHPALNKINEYSQITVQPYYYPYSIGYYAIENNGDFVKFNNSSNPNGNWELTVYESDGTDGISIEKFELVFGTSISLTDYSTSNSNNFCSAASCISNGVIIGTNNGYAQPDPQYPKESVSGCNWNGDNNNSAWFKFVPTTTSARITINGMLNSVTPGANDMQPIVVKANGNCLTPNFVPTGGCPNDESINNKAYLESNGGGISSAGGVYTSGITANCEFNLSDLVVGDIYYLYVDGNGGASSSFYIEVESGVSSSCVTCPNIVVSGSTSICAGSSPVTYSQSGSTATCPGTWSVSPASAGTINSTTGLFTPIASTSSPINAVITYNDGSCTGTLNIAIEKCSFSECNLVAYKVGDGSQTLTSDAFPVLIEELNSSGNLIQTLTRSFTGDNLLTQSGSAESVGMMNSYNGFLSAPGFAVDSGSDLSTSSPKTPLINKVNTIFDKDKVNQSYTRFPTVGTMPFSENHLRSVVPISSNQFYCAGNSLGTPSTGGVWYYNGTSFIQICSIPNNVRNIEIFNGQLYLSTASTTAPIIKGIYQIGSGLPTTSGQTVTPIFNQPNGEPYGFSVSPDGCTAYVADDRSTANGGGIQKWTKVGGIWSLAYTFGSSSRGLTVDYSGVNPVIYATTSETSNNSIIKINDLGSTSTASTLRSAGVNYVFRGIDFTPNSYNSISISQQPSSFTVCEGSSSQELSVSATSSNGSLSYQWYSNSINDYCGATSISGATNLTYSPPVNSIGTIYYFVKITNNCASIKNSNIVAVTVNKAPTVTASVSNSNPCTDATINLTGSFGGSATSGTWTVKSGGGTLNTSVNPPTYTAPSTAGMVILSYTSDDPDGSGPCSAATADVEITVANCVSCPGFWANTQSPASGSICSNDSYNVYGQLYIPGVTEGAGQGANVSAQLGYHTSNTDPSTWPSGNWVNATYNSAVIGNNDEYMGTLSGLSGNTYYYAFRYSYNGCAYVYGGYSAPNASSNIWTVNTNGGSTFVGNSTANGGGSSGINSSNGVAFGLYNNSATPTEAIRNFPSLLVGQTVRFDMDNGWINNGNSVGVGLQNASGNNVWEIYFLGGATGYSVNGSLLSPTVPYTVNGLRVTFTLVTATTYSATIQILNGGATYGPYTGSLLNPVGGQSITRFRAFNFNAGGDGNYNFYFNNIITPSFFDNASTYSSLSNGLQSTTSVGGIWNSPTIGNGTLTVTTSPTPSNAGSTQTICEGTSATLAANAPSPSTSTGVWTITSGPNNDLAQFNNASSNVAVFTPTLPGTYVLRWTITNGSCSSFSDVTINVTSGILDFVNTQFPGTSTICSGESINVYGQVYEPGVTPGSGNGANIEVQVGYHSENTNPNSWTNWIGATHNSALIGNNDEYMGTFGSALSAGTYYYAFRYRLNGCAWQYGGYSISGGGTWDGTNNISGVLTIYNNPGTSGLSMTPSSICEGVPNIEVTAENAGSYELFLNGISQGVPSDKSSWTIPEPLVANDQVCVRGYAANNLISMDGAFNEDFWNPPLVNSAGGAISNSQNRINALYLKNAQGFLNLGIAGKLVFGEDRKIILFVDSKTGGHNSLNTWTNRTSVSVNNGLENLNSQIQFDIDFSADYAISIGTNGSGESFLDFYDMVTNTNNYLGSTITQPTRIAYQANTGATDYSKGYEIRIPINLFGTITSPMKFFAMLTNNPTENEATTLSNQFLSPASNGQGDYGNGAVDFGNAAPNPVSYLLESDCYNEECKKVLAKPTIIAESSVCINKEINLSPNSGGNWTSSNIGIATIDTSGKVIGVSGGKVTFTYTADINGCSSSTNEIDIIEIKTSEIKSE